MVGIDVSKDTLHCTLLDPATRNPVWSRTYKNTPAGVACLLRATAPEFSWALEPTGSYSTRVVQIARAAGRDVLLAQPRKAKRYLQSLQDRAKCDRLDSVGLGLFALSRQLPPYPLKSDEVEHLDQLLQARKGLGLSLQQLQAQAHALPRVSASLQPAIDALKLQQRQIDHDIEALTAGATTTTPSGVPLRTCVQKLQQVPGIGPVTANTLASRLAGRSFPRSDAFVAYCGLDITVRQSGKRSGSQGLTKQGDAELRRLLYLAAQSSLRVKDSPFKAHYDRERAKGLSSTAALVAVARKMARLCWALVQHDQTYDPKRVYLDISPQKNT